jgi:hypothetical protein
VNGVEQPGVVEAIAGRPFEDFDEWDESPRKWARGWRSLIFPGFFLLYLGQVVHGVSVYSSGLPAAIGGVAVLASAPPTSRRSVPAGASTTGGSGSCSRRWSRCW